MSKVGPTANPGMIILARESRGYTQNALAIEMGITQGTLSKVENGQAPASEELVAKLASHLHYPRDFFFEQIDFRNLPVVFYRKRIRVSATLMKQLRARLNIVRQHLVKLLRSVDVETQIPVIDLKEFRSDAELVARDIRIRWHIPPGPIDNLTKTLEDAGIIIVRSDFGTDRVDAISLYEPRDELPPIVLINNTIPNDRYRYALAHETAHILMHHHLPMPDQNVEDQANAFASELLMPRKEIRGFLNRPTLAKLANLKPYWKVSIQALLMRAAQLKVINERQKRYLWAQISGSGYRINEPFPLPPEEPALVRELIDCHIGDLGYDERALSDLLHLEPAEFRSHYRNTNSSGLRLVK